MNNYIVKVKKIKTTEMIVEAENGEQAIINVNELIEKCEENNIDISASFNSKPVYKYSVSKLEDDEYE